MPQLKSCHECQRPYRLSLVVPTGVIVGFHHDYEAVARVIWLYMHRYHDAVEAGLRAVAVDAQDVADCQTTVASEHDMDLLVYAANMAGQVSLHSLLPNPAVTPCLLFS